MEWSFDCHNVNKILYTYWLLKKILKFYHVKAHIISFPTMYNTWGLREWESILKNWRSPKNTTFWANLQAIFPNYLTSRRSGENSGIANLLFFNLTVMVWYLASKWAIRKLDEITIVEVMADIVKPVTGRGNLSKNHYFAWNAKCSNFFVSWIFLDSTTEKWRSQAFQICITLIGLQLN